MIITQQVQDTKAYVDWILKHGEDDDVQEWKNHHPGSSYVDAYIALVEKSGPTIQKTLTFEGDEL